MKLTLFLQFSIICIILFAVVLSIPKWHRIPDGKRYLIEDQYLYNWFQALNECSRRDLQLVAIENAYQSMSLFIVLSDIFQESENERNLWIGATDEYDTDPDRKFYWAATGNEMTYSMWSPNSPSSAHIGENCVHVWNGVRLFKWRTNTCFTRYGYICEEKPIAKRCMQRINGVMEQIMDTCLMPL